MTYCVSLVGSARFDGYQNRAGWVKRGWRFREFTFHLPWDEFEATIVVCVVKIFIFDVF